MLHGLPSSQSSWSPPAHEPPWQMSLPLHTSPSSQGPSCAACWQPLAASQVSLVQSRPSLQFRFSPPVQAPLLHNSLYVQALPSSQSMPPNFLCRHAPLLQLSWVHTLESSQSVAQSTTESALSASAVSASALSASALSASALPAVSAPSLSVASASPTWLASGPASAAASLASLSAATSVAASALSGAVSGSASAPGSTKSSSAIGSSSAGSSVAVAWPVFGVSCRQAGRLDASAKASTTGHKWQIQRDISGCRGRFSMWSLTWGRERNATRHRSRRGRHKAKGPELGQHRIGSAQNWVSTELGQHRPQQAAAGNGSTRGFK